MKNWSTDTRFLKTAPFAFKLWKTEQLINFGMGNAKLETKFLKTNMEKLSIDPAKKDFLSFLLWPKRFFRKTRKNS